MKTKLLVLLIILISLFSCKNQDKKELIESQKEIKTNFIKTFEGKIDDKYKIMMKITSDDGIISGKYFYKSNGVELKLSGEINNGNIILKEFNKDSNQTGMFKGKIINNEKIIGEWSKPDGNKIMNFKLIESNTDYSTALNQSKNIKERINGKYLDIHNNDKDYGEIVIKYLKNNKFKYSLKMILGSLNGRIIEDEGVAELKGKFGYNSKNGCKMNFEFKNDLIIVKPKGSCYMDFFKAEFKKEK